MPKVGKQQFTYDEAGRKAAEAQSELTGEPVINTEGVQEEFPVSPARSEEPIIPSYDAGGRVQRIMGYGDGGKVKKIPKTLESLTPEVNKSTSDKKSDKKKKTIDSELFKQIKESLLDPRKAKTIPLPEFPPLEPTKKKTKRQKILDAAKRILKGKEPKKEVERIQGYNEGGKVKLKKLGYDKGNYKIKDYNKLTSEEKRIGKKYGAKDKGYTNTNKIDYTDDVKFFVALDKQIQRRKSTSRVTKPKAHKSKGKFFPSAKDLKNK